MTRDDIIAGVHAVGPWFHQIDLGDGVRTRDIAPQSGPHPIDNPRDLWDDIKDRIPSDLSGKRVLDVGAADGFFAFEMARRGAAEVVALDEWRNAVRRIAFARDALGYGAIVRARQQSVYDLDPERDGRFDLCLALGLVYHLENPVLALRRIASVTDSAVVESVTVDDPGRSYLYLRAPDPVQRETGPKWFPSVRCLEDMLQWVGFRTVSTQRRASGVRSICWADAGSERTGLPETEIPAAVD